jgi:hypothetical protein
LRGNDGRTLKCRSGERSWAAKEMSMATQVAEKGPLGLENPMGTDRLEFV